MTERDQIEPHVVGEARAIPAKEFTSTRRSGGAVRSSRIQARRQNLYDPAPFYSPAAATPMAAQFAITQSSQPLIRSTLPGTGRSGGAAGYIGGLSLIARTKRFLDDAHNASRDALDMRPSFIDEDKLTREEFDSRLEGLNLDIEWFDGITGAELEIRKEAAYRRALGDVIVGNGGSSLAYSLMESLGGAANNPATIPALLAAPAFGTASATGALFSRATFGSLAKFAAGEAVVEGLSIAGIQGSLEHQDPRSQFNRVSEGFSAGFGAFVASYGLGFLAKGVGAAIPKRAAKEFDVVPVKVAETPEEKLARLSMNPDAGDLDEVVAVATDTRLAKDAPAEIERPMQEENARRIFEDEPQEVADAADEYYELQENPVAAQKAIDDAATGKEKDASAGKDQSDKGSADAPEPQTEKTLEDFMPDPDGNTQITAKTKKGETVLKVNSRTGELAYNAGTSAGAKPLDQLFRGLVDAGVLLPNHKDRTLASQAATTYRRNVDDYLEGLQDLSPTKDFKGQTIELDPRKDIFETIADAKARRAQRELAKPAAEALEVAPQKTKKVIGLGDSTPSAGKLVGSGTPAGKELGELYTQWRDTMARVMSYQAKHGAGDSDIIQQGLREAQGILEEANHVIGTGDFGKVTSDGFSSGMRRMSAQVELRNLSESVLDQIDGKIRGRSDDLAVADVETGTIDPNPKLGANQVEINEAAKELINKSRKFLDEDTIEAATKGQADLDTAARKITECGI